MNQGVQFSQHQDRIDCLPTTNWHPSLDTDCAPLVMIYFFPMNLIWTDIGLSVELMSARPVGGMPEMCINVNFLHFYFMLLFFLHRHVLCC